MLHLEPCLPPRWASSGHAQTIWGHLLPPRITLPPTELIQIPLPGGDSLIAESLDVPNSEWLVYLFHGLGGDSRADYMLRTQRVMTGLGHSVLLVNHRGCGLGRGLALENYHSGRGEDVSEVIRAGRKRFPDKKHLAIGFSLSGNALLNLLTGQRGDCLPDAAISVNAPIDLAASSVKLMTGLSKLYDFRFVVRLRRSTPYLKRIQVQPESRVPFFSTLRTFDELFTSRTSGFKNAEHYYEVCSTKNHLHRITTPTIILTAADDPFIPVESYRAAKPSAAVHLHVEKVGGHMGYLSTQTSFRWLDYALREGVSTLTSRNYSLKYSDQ